MESEITEEATAWVASAAPMKLRHDAAKGSRGARLALEMLEKRPEWLLSTTLVGTNIAVVANSTIATALMISLFGKAGGWRCSWSRR